MSSKTNKIIDSDRLSLPERVQSYQVSVNNYRANLRKDQYTILGMSLGITCSFILFVGILQIMSSLNPIWVIPIITGIFGVKLSWNSFESFKTK